VNAHRKFPVDARHNAYYAADGSDLRDATTGEVKKYRLAASHKRRKPESSCDKSESATLVSDVKKTDIVHAAKSEDKKKSGHTSRKVDDEDRRQCDKERPASRESKGERTPSRGPKDERIANRDSQRKRDTGHRGSGDSVSGRSSERDRQTIRDSTTGMDDDERDLAMQLDFPQLDTAGEYKQLHKEVLADRGR